MTSSTRRTLADGDVFLFLTAYMILALALYYARRSQGQATMCLTSFCMISSVQGALLFGKAPPTRRSLWCARAWTGLWCALTCVVAFS